MLFRLPALWRAPYSFCVECGARLFSPTVFVMEVTLFLAVLISSV